MLIVVMYSYLAVPLLLIELCTSLHYLCRVNSSAIDERFSLVHAKTGITLGRAYRQLRV